MRLALASCLNQEWGLPWQGGGVHVKALLQQTAQVAQVMLLHCLQKLLHKPQRAQQDELAARALATSCDCVMQGECPQVKQVCCQVHVFPGCTDFEHWFKAVEFLPGGQTPMYPHVLIKMWVIVLGLPAGSR